jgi:hypothetical protein
VRSLGLLPESLSHDWHVQPSCQRPNRTPPERREFSPGELARMRIRLSSKPYQHTVRRKILSTSTSHRLSTCFAHGKVPIGDACRRTRLPPKSRFLRIKPFGMTTFECRARLQRATIWSSALAPMETPHRTFGARRGGRLEIEKRSYVWRSFLKEPFGSVLFPNRSPVAGTDLEGLIAFLTYIDAGQRRELQNNTPG